MKKKKLTRKSLDELEKIMPVLSEDEQRSCVGGAHFYDYSGNYLGKVGNDNDIRIIENRTEINNLKCISEQLINDPSYSTASRWGYSLTDAKFDVNTINKIYLHATGVDLAATFTRGVSYASGISPAMMVSMESGGPSGAASIFDIVVNHGHKYSIDITTAKSLFVHEVYHTKNPFGSEWERENNAYTAQTSAAGFKDLRKDFREFIRNQWLNAYSKINNSAESKKEQSVANQL